MKTHDQTKQEVLDELKRRGIGVEPSAMGPLKQVDFSHLVSILDHEERFLTTVFIHNLLGLVDGRPQSGQIANNVTAEDVENALRMLGVVSERQKDPVLSTTTRGAIKNACPYC